MKHPLMALRCRLLIRTCAAADAATSSVLVQPPLPLAVTALATIPNSQNLFQADTRRCGDNDLITGYKNGIHYVV